MLLNISGIRLRLTEEAITSLPEECKKFLERKNGRQKDVWRLEFRQLHEPRSQGAVIDAATQKKSIFKKNFFRRQYLEKENSPDPSNYFDQPVLLNTRKKTITLRKKTVDSNTLNLRLLSYIFSQALATKRGLLLHAASVILDKKAYLFFAPSGGGKSTVARLSRKHRVAADDVAIIRKIRENYFSFFSPWYPYPSKKINKKSKAKVKAIFFLKKAKRVSFKPIRQEEALARILSTSIHFLMFTEPPLARKIFRTVANLTRSLPAYEMKFVKNKDFWPQLKKALISP